MSWSLFQRLALIAFITVEVLIFVGAVVRASGSGLGCPDWPFCYGCLTPPTRAEAIDFSKIDLEKFRAKAARHGRDPASITEETLRAEFDPVATWVEYLNRLTSVPVGISMLVLLVASFGQVRQGRGRVCLAAVSAFVLVLVNAWLGAQVVFSGLKPGIITLHMALAVALQGVLVYAAWRGCDQPWRLIGRDGSAAGGLRGLGWILLGIVVLEGVLGSQVRELTDQLARSHAGEARIQWVAELEHSWVYLVHRSFSWFILMVGLAFFLKARRWLGRSGWLELSVFGLIVAQMFLGLVLAHIGIVAVAQVLHIGLSSLLVSALFLWLLGASGAKLARASGASGHSE